MAVASRVVGQLRQVGNTQIVQVCIDWTAIRCDTRGQRVSQLCLCQVPPQEPIIGVRVEILSGEAEVVTNTWQVK